jgi:hypothetical protein
MVFIEKSSYSKVCYRGVPRMLTDAYREASKAVTTDLLHPHNVGDEDLCCHKSSRVTKFRSNMLNSNSRSNRWNGIK